MGSYNKSRKFAKVVAIIVVAAMVITSLTFLLPLATAYGASPEDEKYFDGETKILREYIDAIEQYYVEEVSYEELMQGAFEGVVEALGDPYSTYYPTAESEEAQLGSYKGAYEGVGLTLLPGDDGVQVSGFVKGGPAQKADAQIGDTIVAIDGTDVSDEPADAISNKLRGKAGTKVSLTVNRGGRRLTFEITRAVIDVPSVASEMLENNVGYIYIEEFDADTGDEFAAVKADLIGKGAKSLIIDLRNNGGGMLQPALLVAEQLMPTGKIISVQKSKDDYAVIEGEGTGYQKMPVVLLVNGMSASSSEIVAAALKDNNAATLVGTRTYGKGVAQVVLAFENGSSLKLSSFYFLTPDGNDINGIGIEPDYTVADNRGVDIEALEHIYHDFAPMSESEKYWPEQTGLNVYGAQQRLAMLGYETAATGTMDATTVDAIKKFQAESGLYAYGVLDYTTMDKLEEACLNAAAGSGDGEDVQLEKAIEILTK